MADRYYLVTFDLQNSKGREAEYAKARGALQFLVGSSNYYGLLKQCSIVRTSLMASRLQQTLMQILGQNCNILIVRLRYGYSFRIRDPQIRQRAKELLNNIPSE